MQQQLHDKSGQISYIVLQIDSLYSCSSFILTSLICNAFSIGVEEQLKMEKKAENQYLVHFISVLSLVKEKQWQVREPYFI